MDELHETLFTAITEGALETVKSIIPELITPDYLFPKQYYMSSQTENGEQIHFNEITPFVCAFFSAKFPILNYLYNSCNASPSPVVGISMFEETTDQIPPLDSYTSVPLVVGLVAIPKMLKILSHFLEAIEHTYIPQAFVQAIYMKEFESIKILLNNYYADLNLIDPDSLTTPLHMSVVSCPEMAPVLLKLGANKNIQDSTGMTSWMIALSDRNTVLVDTFLQHSPILGCLVNSDGLGALSFAVLSEDLSLLIKMATADTPVSGSDGHLAALLTVKLNRPDMLKVLIKLGLPINNSTTTKHLLNLSKTNNLTEITSILETTDSKTTPVWANPTVKLTVTRNECLMTSREECSLVNNMFYALLQGDTALVKTLLTLPVYTHPSNTKNTDSKSPNPKSPDTKHLFSPRILSYPAQIKGIADPLVFTALKAGRYDEFLLFLDQGVNSNLQFEGISLLTCACQGSSLEVVQTLIDRKASLDGEGSNNPLLSAICSGNMDIITYLYNSHLWHPSEKQPTNQTTYNSITSLSHRSKISDMAAQVLSAAVTNHGADFVKQLIDIASSQIDLVAYINTTIPEQNITSFKLAEKIGKADIIALFRHLIRKDSDSSNTAPTESVVPPLLRLIRDNSSSNVNSIIALLENGADPNVTDIFGNNALITAAQRTQNCLTFMKALLPSVNHDHTDYFGQNYVHHLVKTNPDVFVTLFKDGVISPSLLTHECYNGVRPFFDFIPTSSNGYSLISNHTGNEKGIDILLSDENGYTIVHYLATKSLVRFKAFVDWFNLINDDTQAVSLLLTLQTICGNTPLHLACYYDQLEIVKYIQSTGFNMNTTNLYKYTPLDMCYYVDAKQTFAYLSSLRCYGNIRSNAEALIDNLRDTHPCHYLLCLDADDLKHPTRSFTLQHRCAANAFREYLQLGIANQGLTSKSMQDVVNLKEKHLNDIIFKNNMTPLMICILTQDIATFNALLNANVDPDVQLPGGEDALYLATILRMPGMVQSLLQTSASGFRRGDHPHANRSITAFDKAEAYGYTEIVDIFNDWNKKADVIEERIQKEIKLAQKSLKKMDLASKKKKNGK